MARVVEDHPAPIPPGCDRPRVCPAVRVFSNLVGIDIALRRGTVNPLHRYAICRLEIRGSPPAGVTADIDRRFGPVDVVVGRYRTVLRVLIQDQAALRGLLTRLCNRSRRTSWLHSRPQP